MKTNSTIYLNLEIASIIIGVLVIIASFVPAIMEMGFNFHSSLYTTNFFLWGFLIGAAVMVGGALIFGHLDDIYND